MLNSIAILLLVSGLVDIVAGLGILAYVPLLIVGWMFGVLRKPQIGYTPEELKRLGGWYADQPPLPLGPSPQPPPSDGTPPADPLYATLTPGSPAKRRWKLGAIAQERIVIAVLYVFVAGALAFWTPLGRLFWSWFGWWSIAIVVGGGVLGTAAPGGEREHLSPGIGLRSGHGLLAIGYVLGRRSRHVKGDGRHRIPWLW